MKKLHIIGTLVVLALLNLGLYNFKPKEKIVMGGEYNQQICEDKEIATLTIEEENYNEKYFRPSKSEALNTKNTENISKAKTPEETIINYFSILREAANPDDKSNTGCGTLGEALNPYPKAYEYLDKDYKNRLSYKEFLKSFENILHINLIKMEQVPSDKEHPNDLKYFVELETIEGSQKGVGYFAYYYGYIYLSEENGEYKISNIDYTGENYLCAPYHGWAYDAELSVDIRYGDWCKLIKEKFPVEKDDFHKKIKFIGTDNQEYIILFFTLTNGTDLEIAQYKKDADGKWKLIHLDPTKCLDNK